jgi:hypothetical protein
MPTYLTAETMKGFNGTFTFTRARRNERINNSSTLWVATLIKCPWGRSKDTSTVIMGGICVAEENPGSFAKLFPKKPCIGALIEKLALLMFDQWLIQFANSFNQGYAYSPTENRSWDIRTRAFTNANSGSQSYMQRCDSLYNTRQPITENSHRPMPLKVH